MFRFIKRQFGSQESSRPPSLIERGSVRKVHRRYRLELESLEQRLVLSPISDKYSALGGPQGVLGPALTTELPMPSGVGLYEQYQNGAIYWTPNANQPNLADQTTWTAKAVFGTIYTEWVQLQSQGINLGAPTGDAQPAYQGAIQFFANSVGNFAPGTGPINSSIFAPTTGSAFLVTGNGYDGTVYQQMLYDYRDQYGYLVSRHPDGTPSGLGDASTFTAVAAVTTALKGDNTATAVFLNALVNDSWDSQGHPIRHPDVPDPSNPAVPRPMSQDSFGPIVSAAYYAYTSTASSDQVKGLARQLIGEFINYLIPNQWLLSNVTSDGGDGPDTFLIMPSERYAFQNVVSKMGFDTSAWNIWGDTVPASLVQVTENYIAQAVSTLAGKTLDYVLQHVNLAIPYDIPLGGSFGNWSDLTGQVSISIPDNLRHFSLNATGSTRS